MFRSDFTSPAIDTKPPIVPPYLLSTYVVISSSDITFCNRIELDGLGNDSLSCFNIDLSASDKSDTVVVVILIYSLSVIENLSSSLGK